MCTVPLHARGTRVRNKRQGFKTGIPSSALFSLVREEKPISTGQMGLLGEVAPWTPGWLYFREPTVDLGSTRGAVRAAPQQ